MKRPFRRRDARPIDVDKLRRLWPTRLPDKEIAARMGHGIGAIRRRAAQIGLRRRREIWAEDAA